MWQTKTPYAKNRAASHFTCRAQTYGASRCDDAQPFPVAHAHGSPIVAASRLPSFQLQTKTGTVAGRSPRRGQLRFAVPARIALQGGERAGSVAICPCPPQEESDSGDLPGRMTAPGPGHQLRPSIAWPACPYATAVKTHGCVLAEPSKNNKKRGWGQRIRPHRKEFPRSTRSSAAPRLRFPEKNRPGAWCSACCRGCARSPARHRAHHPCLRPR